MTFTRRAAGELRERLERLVGPERAAAVAVRTFHAFGLDVLAGAPDLIGRGPELRVLDEDASPRDPRRRDRGTRPAEARRLAEAIARAKERLLGPDDVPDAGLADAYRRYEAALAEAGAVDFDDLIRLAVRLLREHPARSRGLAGPLPLDPRGRVPGRERCAVRAAAPARPNGRARHRASATRTRPSTASAAPTPRASAGSWRSSRAPAPSGCAAATAARTRCCARARRVVAPDEPADLLRAVKPGGAPVVLHETAAEDAEAETVAREIERLVGGTSLLAMHDGADGLDEAGPADIGFADIAVPVPHARTGRGARGGARPRGDPGPAREHAAGREPPLRRARRARRAHVPARLEGARVPRRLRDRLRGGAPAVPAAGRDAARTWTSRRSGGCSTWA